MKKPATDQRVPPATVADIGRALYGPHWQVLLARAMKQPEQAVRRWTNDGCPAELAPNLRKLLEERVVDVQRVLKTLEDFNNEDSQ